jgi:hypothetical protein
VLITEISWIRGRDLIANVASERTTMPRIVKANPRKYRDNEFSHWGFSPVPVRGLPITLHAATTLCTRVSKKMPPPVTAKLSSTVIFRITNQG